MQKKHGQQKGGGAFTTRKLKKMPPIDSVEGEVHGLR